VHVEIERRILFSICAFQIIICMQEFVEAFAGFVYVVNIVPVPFKFRMLKA
jgi:hypothetical protein